ncbi:MAG: hypothetical protein LUO79_07775 [Methanomassiliicoccales archaeon]|nr:hypothetical protein [Methanomassiliicoccales archaeon]
MSEGGDNFSALTPDSFAAKIAAIAVSTTDIDPGPAFTNGSSVDPEGFFKAGEEAADAQHVEDVSKRVPPHDLDAEAAVLSAAMTDPSAMDKLEGLHPEHFYSEAHRRIFEAAATLHATGTERPDIVLVAAWLRDRERLTQVGGFPYLTQVLNAAPAVANVRKYAEIVLQLFKQREFLKACQLASEEIYANRDVDFAVGYVRSRLEQFAPIDTRRKLTSHNTFDHWLEEGPLVHEPISLGPLDELTGGGPVYGSRWYILGAPDACKTLFAVQTAHVLAMRGVKVGILAVDEEPSDIQTRLVQRIGFTRKDAEVRDPKKIAHMRSVMQQFAPIRYFDAGDTIESASEELYKDAKGGKAALIIDSVQTASCEALLSLREEPTEYQRVTRNVQAIRACATRYRLITFATSEMNRQAYNDISKNDPPSPKKQKSHMASGKQSGAIEYSARVMLSFENALSQGELLPDTFKVAVEKNKHGPRGNFFYIGIDRARMMLAHVPGPDAQAEEMAAAEERRRQKAASEAEKARMKEAAREAKENAERASRAQREAADDAACLLLVTERPGIGAHDLRGLMAAKLGGCERKRVEESVARLMLRNLVRVEQDGPRKPARHFPVSDKDSKPSLEAPGEAQNGDL